MPLRPGPSISAAAAFMPPRMMMSFRAVDVEQVMTTVPCDLEEVTAAQIALLIERCGQAERVAPQQHPRRPALAIGSVPQHRFPRVQASDPPDAMRVLTRAQVAVAALRHTSIQSA